MAFLGAAETRCIEDGTLQSAGGGLRRCVELLLGYFYPYQVRRIASYSEKNHSEVLVVMKKILFDATVLVDGNDMVEERRGIYFIARELLLEMKRRLPGQILLYATTYKISGLKKVQQSLSIKVNLYRKPPFFSEILYNVAIWFRRKRMDNIDRPLRRKFFSLGILFPSIVGTTLFFFSNLFYNMDDVVFFSPRSSAPWFINRNKKIKKYIVLHDLIPYLESGHLEMKMWGWFAHLIRHLNGVDHYFAISESTKADYLRFTGKISPEQVNVVYWAPLKMYGADISRERKFEVERKYNIPKEKKYVFALGSFEPRKNLIRIARSFVTFIEKNEISDLILIVGGGNQELFIPTMEKQVGNFLKYRNSIIHIGYIQDCDLPVFYSFAEWFVFTSRYEGFGLPPLEAMKCGCPVITSNNSSLPEVVGDAGIMIDWDDDGQHVRAYEKLYFDEHLRREYRHRALKRAACFSWTKTTKIILTEMGLLCLRDT